MDYKYVCDACGSDNIQIRTWVNPNDNEVEEFVDDADYYMCFCKNCADLSYWKEILTITKKEAKNYILKDDDTELGGTARFGETLAEFMESAQIPYTASIEDIDNALIECGIKPVFKCS